MDITEGELKPLSEEEGLKTDLYFIGVTFPDLVLFDLDLLHRELRDKNFENLKGMHFEKKIRLKNI